MTIIEDRFLEGKAVTNSDLSEYPDRLLLAMVPDPQAEAVLRRRGVLTAIRRRGTTFHLPGQHDQQRHAGAGGGVTHLDVGTTYSSLTPAQQDLVDRNLARFEVTQEDLEDEIRAHVGDKLSEARRWYPEAKEFNEELAAKYGVPVDRVTALTAAVSPQAPWNQNKWVAQHVLLHREDHPELSPVDASRAMGGWMAREMGAGLSIIRGEQSVDSLTGMKRRSFFNNMSNPGGTDHVTVDTWVARSILEPSPTANTVQDAQQFMTGTGLPGIKSKAAAGIQPGYVSIADAVRSVAADMGESPDTIQAAYWLYARESRIGEAA